LSILLSCQRTSWLQLRVIQLIQQPQNLSTAQPLTQILQLREK
jgi:hypothetical protein